MTSSPDPDSLSFQGLAESAPIMIWMAGLDLGCFYFNQAWLQFRGRTLAEEYGNGWAEGVHPEDLGACVAHYTSCFEHRLPFAMNYRLRHFSGEYFWILDRGAPHYAADGTFLGFFGGCAETETLTPVVLNSQLRTSLDGIALWARTLAETHLNAPAAGSTPPLKAFARHLHRSREEKNAATQLGRLAADMLTYATIPRGAHLT
ncbi:MAG TPA: PAS domain-containing protein [Lacunisphaera sp.]|nr:PAS domain-containing protein [Lacunisphaera sp.]